MSTQLSFDTARTALLSMDYQAGIVSIYGGDGKEELLARAAGGLGGARVSGMTVVHVRVGFRPGLPEVSARNPLFASVKSSARHLQLFEGEAGRIRQEVKDTPGPSTTTWA